MIITYDELLTCKVQTTVHADSRDAAYWFAHIVEFPQITRERTFWRKAKRTVDIWFVDGAEVLDLEEVVEVMNGEKLPLAQQIEGLRDVLKRADDDTPVAAIESAIKTLEWCAENAQGLRDYRAHKRAGR